MNATLHFPLIYSVVFEGKKYKLNPYFDVILKVFALQKETDLSEKCKVELSIELIVKDNVKISHFKQIELLDAIYDVLIHIPSGNSDNSPPVVDFEQDSGFIYSSFYADYGIDLYESQGKLHWWKFLQLFKGLSDKTKIVQVMQIRSRQIPAPTKYNAEERLGLIKLKSQYALHFTEAEREKNLASELQRLATIMQGMATEGVR